MAEVGLVASIFGVASFGTKVATSLYEAADVMIHAHQQIASMAKHVSQFTAVLRHLGRVLEAEKGSCSKDLLREIRKIKRSCKSTFKEINATVMSRQFRSFVPVRWLFKKTKAKELEARLDSEQSMLQVMIHTVTVSKLGDMQSKSKEDSQQILGLKDEIQLLKTLIVENYNNSIELQHAEQFTEVESRGFPPPRSNIHQGSHPSYDSQETLSAGRLDIPSLNHARSRKSPSPAPSLSESDHEEVGPVGMAGSARPTASRNRVDQGHSESSTDDAHATDEVQVSTVKQLSEHNSTVGFGAYRASTSLLQMVPYRPNVTHSAQRNRFISAGPDTAPRSAVESATGTVRLLLDKWTTSGSGPISELLAETDCTQQPAQDTTHKNNQTEPHFLRPRTPPRPPSFTSEFSDHESDAAFYPLPLHDYSDMRGAFMPRPSPWPVPPNTAWEPPEGPPHPIAQTRSKDVWRDSPFGGQVSATSVGNDMLKSLRYTHGGIVYTKSNDFKYMYFVDGDEFYRFYLVPWSMVPSNESEIKRTEIGNGWVRREALDLLGYSYSETLSGQFSIPRDLTINEIEELVVFSYQADNRRLAERSRQIIKERGWREEIIAWSQEEARMAPTVYPSFHEPWRRSSTTHPHYSRPGVDIGLYHPGRREHGRASTSPPELQDLPLPEELREANPKSQPKGTEGAREKKPAVPEVRFTVPRLEPTQQTTRMPPSRRPTSGISESDIQRKGQEQELREAMDKLERLKKNLNEAVKTGNYAVKSDLEYYAISDLESRIETLKQDRKKDESDGKSAPAEKQGRVPLTAVETDSEESEEPESKAADVNDSENGSAEQDLYE